METKESVQFGYSEYITTAEEAVLIKNVVLPKLKQGKNVNLFCSFSYFTSNYTGIFLMKELANLMKQGCTLYLLMWDINCECHPYFVRLLKREKVTPDKIIESKMQEILALFKSFDAPMSRLHLYRASDVLTRFVRKQNPNLFIQFYGAMERLDLNNLVHKHKASHLIQMPLDIFFAHFLNELYPEDLKERIEVMLCYGYQGTIFREVRKVMHGDEQVQNFSPLLLILPHHPYLIYDGAIPEWTMTKDAVVQHILSYKPTKEEIAQMYDVILRKFLTEFEFLDKDKTIKLLPFKQFLDRQAQLSLENQQVSLAYNLYNYLSTVKKGMTTVPSSRTIHLTNGAEAVKYAKLLSRTRILDILKTINGTQNATQLAKELKIARSNMSNYLKQLQKHDMISVAEDGIIHRKTSAITTNFEVGLH